MAPLPTWQAFQSSNRSKKALVLFLITIKNQKLRMTKYAVSELNFPCLNLVLFIGLGLKMQPQIPFLVSQLSLTPWKTFVICMLNYAILVLHDYHFTRPRNLPFSIEQIKSVTELCTSCQYLNPKFINSNQRTLVKAM